MCNPIKVAAGTFRPSRAMIPGELLCASFAFTLAWSGLGWWPGHAGSLHSLLNLTGQVYVWAFALGVPALVLAITDILEWSGGKVWCACGISANCARRRIAIGVLGLGWVYVIYFLGEYTEFGAVSVLSFQSIFAALFCGWSFIENWAVQRSIRKVHGVDYGILYVPR